MNHLCCGAKFKGSQCESILGKSCSQAFSVTFAKLQYPSTNPWLTSLGTFGRGTEDARFGEAHLMGALPHTNSIHSLPAWGMCRRRHGENEQEQQERMNRGRSMRTLFHKWSGC